MQRQEQTPDGIRHTPESSESLFIEPSPLESSYDTMMQQFGASLLPPYINQHEQMVRVARPVEVNGTILAFEYWRRDPLEEDTRDVWCMMRALNPQFFNGVEDAEDHKGGIMGVLDFIEKTDDYSDKIRARIVARDGRQNLV